MLDFWARVWKWRKGSVSVLNELEKSYRWVISCIQITIKASHRGWRRGTLLVIKGSGKAEVGLEGWVRLGLFWPGAGRVMGKSCKKQHEQAHGTRKAGCMWQRKQAIYNSSIIYHSWYNFHWLCKRQNELKFLGGKWAKIHHTLWQWISFTQFCILGCRILKPIVS